MFDEVIRLGASASPGTDAPSYAVANRAAALLALQRYGEARAQADDALAIARRAGSAQFQASALLTKAAALMEDSDTAGAAETLAAADTLVGTLPADAGDVPAKDALFTALHGELHRLAESHLRRSGGDLTLGTTTL
jgi:hypothetical protein